MQDQLALTFFKSFLKVFILLRSGYGFGRDFYKHFDQVSNDLSNNI